MYFGTPITDYMRSAPKDGNKRFKSTDFPRIEAAYHKFVSNDSETISNIYKKIQDIISLEDFTDFCSDPGIDRENYAKIQAEQQISILILTILLAPLSFIYALRVYRKKKKKLK